MSTRGPVLAAPFLLGTALCLWRVPAAAGLGIDELQLRLDAGREPPLRWDNIEGPPQWMSGAPPRQVREAGMHLIRLEPGSAVTVRLESRSMLRVRSPFAPVATEDLELSVSDGSGLYVEMAARAAGGSDLVLDPEAAHAVLARVARPSSRHDAMELALFASRGEPSGPIAYRRLLPLAGEPLAVARSRLAGAVRFRRLTPEAPASLAVEGPVRLAIETRVLYPPHEAQAFQAYKVYASLDASPYAALELETTLDLLPLFVNGRERPVGRLETAYLDVPQGRHTLTLEPTVALAARLLARERDYLLPGLNQDADEAEVIARYEPPLAPPGELTEEGAARIAAEGPRDIGETYRLALRLRRDNARPDGGLTAASLLTAAAKALPGLKRDAESFWGFHTFYRDLLPVETRDPASQRVGYFVARRLRSAGEEVRAIAVSESLLESPPEGLSRGFFQRLPRGEERAFAYPLPERHAPSRLRVAVQNGPDSAAAELMVQIDRGKPIRLRVVPGPERPPEEYRAASADAQLAALEWLHRWPVAGWPVVLAGVAELPLPVGAREVRLWSESAGDLRVAVQYRASKRYRMSASEYRDAVRRAGGEAAAREAFLAALGGQSRSGVPGSPLWELRNHWDGLLRLLAARERVFADAVAPAAPEQAGAAPGLATDGGAALAEEPRAFERQGQWLPALESWSAVYHASSGPLWREAAFGRIRALEELGESFLAQRQLRGLFLHGGDAETRREALARLREFYARAGDPEEQSAVWATAGRRSPAPEIVPALVDALTSEGELELASMAGMALGRSAELPPSSLARAALGARLWGLFEEALTRLSGTPAESYWRGRRRAAAGDVEGALALLERGGAAGLTLAAHLRRGRDIRARLASREPAERAAAALEWERWQVEEPGPWTWRDEPALVVDHAGGAITHAIERDVHALHFKAAPLRPVRLEALGPITLRIEARPLHGAPSPTSLDDWLFVREEGRLQIVPINANRPTPSLRLVGDPAALVGRQVEATVPLGPGLHRIEVTPGRVVVLVRVRARRPEILSGILPELTRESLARVLRGPEKGKRAARPWGSVRLLPVEGGRAATLPLLPQVTLRLDDALPALPGLSALDAARIALRLGAPLAREGESAGLADLFAEAEDLSPEERLLALERLGDRRAGCQGLSRLGFEVPTAVREAACLAEGDFEAALALAPGRDPEDVARRLSLLQRLSEEHPEQAPRVQALAETLFAAAPRHEGTQSIHARLTRDSAWAPAPSASSSAGLRQVEFMGWSPEHPRARVQRALLPPLSPEDQIASGSGRLVLSFANRAPAQVELDLMLYELEYLPPAPLTASVQLDGGPEERIQLTPEAPRQTLRLTVPPGRHAVRAGIVEPLVDQFLRVRARERRAGAWAPIVGTLDRSYHLATPEEPLKVDLAGPAWIRVDEYRGGKTLIRYEAVPPEGRSLEIRPEGGRNESLLRLFQRVPEMGATRVLPRPLRAAPGPGPLPLLEIADASEPPPLAVLDALRLGRQEDPTWSATSTLERRILFDEDPSGRNLSQEFLELRLARRFFDPYRRRYDRSDFLARANRHGGQTLGVHEELHHRPALSSLNFEARANAYLQAGKRLEGSTSDAVRWSIAVRGGVRQRRELGPKTHHTPALALFARALSLTADEVVDPGEIDRDVFTRYKAQHRAGAFLSETLTHAPWLDTRWSVSAALASNERILERPDHVRLEAGWKQKIADLQLTAEYRSVWFFADRDRARGLTRRALSLEVAGDLWRGNRRRLELGLVFLSHLDEGRSSAGVSLSFHDDHGRGFRDFAPGSVEFLDLRDRRAARTANNRLRDEEP